MRITFSMPSAARYFSSSSAADSPPLDAQLTPMIPGFRQRFPAGVTFSIWEVRRVKMVLIAIAPSAADFSGPDRDADVRHLGGTRT